MYKALKQGPGFFSGIHIQRGIKTLCYNDSEKCFFLYLQLSLLQFVNCM